MRKAVFLFFAVAAAGGLAVSHLQAQSLETGKWNGRMLHPSGTSLDLFFHVSDAGDSLQLSMEVPSFRTFPVHAARLDGDRLTFWFSSAVRLDCALDRQKDGSFQGGCLDAWGGRGPIVMVPPSVDLNTVHVNEDAFFAGWEPPEQPKTHSELLAESELPPGQRVDVGGYRLNMLSMGEGEVTVVLEAGLGDNLGVWRIVQKRVSAFARVVAYDRAGLGYSDPGPLPRSPEQIAQELHQLLQRSGIAPPYVLVAQAEGGFAVRRFASLYPNEVAGLVLVDPSHEDQGARWQALDAASWAKYVREKKAFYASLQGTIQAEYDAYLRVLEDRKVSGVGALPDVPLAVLTAMRPVGQPRWVGETPEGQQVKYALHQAWVDQAGNGVHYVAKKSGPSMPLEEPGLVVKAIRQVVEAAEKKMGSR